MSENQHFCLKWNNHQSTLVSLFPSLLDTNTFVDCTLAASGKQVQAHKVVLSACSPYFKELLVQHNDKHPIIILNNVQASELVAIVEFMYKGEVNISQEHLSDFLKAAKTLQIKGLTDSKNDEDPNDRVLTNEVKKSDQQSNLQQVQSSERKSPLPPVSSDSPKDIVSSDILSSSGNYSDSSINNMTPIKLENWDDDGDDVYEDDLNEDTSVTQVPFTVPVNLSDTHVPESYTKNDYYYRNFLTTPMKDLFHRSNLPNLKEDNKESSILSTQGLYPVQMRRLNSVEATFACETCHKRYRSKTSLNLHRRWECGKEPRFMCPFCDKRTHQKGNLKVHIMSRHRDKISVDSQQQQSSLSSLLLT